MTESPFGPPGSTSGADGTIAGSHVYADDGTYTVTVTVTDDDGASTSDTLTVTVDNVAPTINAASLNNSSPECGGAHAGDPINISVDFSDPGFDNVAGGTEEAFTTSTIDWGDGTVETVPALSVNEVDGSPAVDTSGTVAGSHVYASGGVYTVTITVRDDNGGSDQIQTTVVTSGVGIVGDTLYVVGTDGDDQVNLHNVGGGDNRGRGRGFGGGRGNGGPDHIRVHANFLSQTNGGGSHRGWKDFEHGAFERIVVLLCDGDDHANVAGNVSIDTLIDGGAGNDHLNGGHGSSILLGGDGNDRLNAGHARDLLFGGRGADVLMGHHQDDILVSGYTSYEASETDNGLPDEDALFAILAEWQASRDFTDRQDNLSGPVTATLPRNNDDFFLRLGQEVFEDEDHDVLRAGKGQDWIFASANDFTG